MELKNTIILGLLALAGLTSCEMKDELIGKDKGSSDTGLLNVGVLVDGHVNNMQTTRSSDDEAISTSPSADGFKLDVIDSEGFTKTFTYKTEGMEAIELPVGEYTVYAHSTFDFGNILYEPYYGGKQSLSIKKGITSEADVTCLMENTKIKIAYTSEFRSTFKTWNITITAGTLIHPISDEDGTDPAAVYLKIPENTTQIAVHVDAYKEDGTKVTDNVNITKPADTDANWLGNDALTINMTPGEMKPSNPNQPSEPVNPSPEDPDTDPEQPGEDGDDEDTSSTISGIEITVDGVFGEQDSESIKVPVTPGEDTGTDEGDDDSGDDNTGEDKPGEDDEEDASTLKLSGKYLDEPLNYTQGSGVFPDVTINMEASAGLAKVEVKVISSNEDFEGAVAALNLTKEPNGTNLITDEKLQEAKLFELPYSGQTKYPFSLGELGSLLAGFVGEHQFKVLVTDSKGQTVEGTLKVNIIAGE